MLLKITQAKPKTSTDTARQHVRATPRIEWREARKDRPARVTGRAIRPTRNRWHETKQFEVMKKKSCPKKPEELFMGFFGHLFFFIMRSARSAGAGSIRRAKRRDYFVVFVLHVYQPFARCYVNMTCYLPCMIDLLYATTEDRNLALGVALRAAYTALVDAHTLANICLVRDSHTHTPEQHEGLRALSRDAAASADFMRSCAVLLLNLSVG